MALDPSDLAILNRRIRPLVDEKLIAEHRAEPFGRHSAELVEVLHFLRRNPDPELPRYLLVRGDDPPRWWIGRRGAQPGDPVTPLDKVRFSTHAEAEHAVFRRRLADYGASP